MNKAQFHKTSDESIETTREVLKTSLASIEKLTKINLDASKKFLQETSKALKEMSNIKNPKDLFEKVNQLATHTVESNMSSCRDIYGVITDTQTKIKKMLESHIQTAQKNIASATENFSKLNTAGKSGFTTDTVKKWLHSANEAMSALNKLTGKTTIAKSASSAARPAVKRTTVSRAKPSTTKKATSAKAATAKKPVKK